MNQNERTETSANTLPNATIARRSRAGYVSHSGTVRSVANFVHAASAASPPRAGGAEAAKNPQIRSAGMTASFVFELEAYCVNGFATHASANTAARRLPP